MRAGGENHDADFTHGHPARAVGDSTPWQLELTAARGLQFIQCALSQGCIGVIVNAGDGAPLMMIADNAMELNQGAAVGRGLTPVMVTWYRALQQFGHDSAPGDRRNQGQFVERLRGIRALQ